MELTVNRARDLGADIARALVSHLPTVEVAEAQLWRELFFGNEAGNLEIAGWLVDPDHDGVPNLVEYAFNLHPGRSDSASSVQGSGVSGIPSIRFVREPEANRLHLEYLRRKSSSAPDVIYSPEVSENLDSQGGEGWRTATGAETVTSIDATWERVILQLPADVPARFARVRVTSVP